MDSDAIHVSLLCVPKFGELFGPPRISFMIPSLVRHAEAAADSFWREPRWSVRSVLSAVATLLTCDQSGMRLGEEKARKTKKWNIHDQKSNGLEFNWYWL